MTSRHPINKWFQDGPPSSYKIQLLYVDIPQHLKLKKRVVDTPFRFRNFEEAENTAADMFRGFDFKIVGSHDEPHWQKPENKMKTDTLAAQNWYDIYGVTPSYQIDHVERKRKALEKHKEDPRYKELTKLKPAVPKKVQSVQGKQRKQSTQSAQRTA